MRVWLWVLMCFAAGPAAAGEVTVHLALNLDRADSGCTLQAPDAALAGIDLRIRLQVTDQQVAPAMLERCVEGDWLAADATGLLVELRAEAGSDGADQLILRTHLSTFQHYPQPRLHLWTADPASGATDSLLPGLALELALGDAPEPVPALGSVGIVLLMLSGLALATVKRRSWPALGVVALLAHAPLGVRAQDAQLAWAGDAVNDARPAAIDLTDVSVDIDGSEVSIALSLNNLTSGGLGASAKVLFIGNSLTYSNDMPDMLAALADSAGLDLQVDAITEPGAALEDHFRARSAHGAIATGGYQLVILQQGPSSLPESQAHLLEWTTRYNTRIRAGGAKPALYMVWPDISRLSFFNAVHASYSNAALAVGGMFIPAGESWRIAWATDPELPLYAADQFHPSPLGSYAAALTIFCALYQQNPLGLTARLSLPTGTVQIDPAQAGAVQRAAWQAWRTYGRNGE